MTIEIPELPHHCNSWIVIEKATGRAVCETWSRKYLECFDPEKAEVKTAADHLASLNKWPAESDDKAGHL